MDNKLYFSTNCFLSYQIAIKYFKGQLRFWASPNFGDKFRSFTTNPPSSSPKALFKRLSEDVMAEDEGSLKIRQVKSSLRSAAIIYYKAGKISKEDYDEILLILKRATIAAFKPLIYIVNLEKIDPVNILKPTLDIRASLFSEEIILQNILADEIKIIDLV
jgi:hypothetical protein